MTPLLRLAQAVLGGSNGLARELATRAMDRASREQRARKARSRTLPRHPAAERADREKRQAETEKNEETAELRRLAMERAAGRCELCRGPMFESFNFVPEMAHLCGGSGKRREEQSIQTVLMAHRVCHQGKRGLDKEPLRWLPEIKAWAARHGYPVPRRFLKLEALHPEVKP